MKWVFLLWVTFLCSIPIAGAQYLKSTSIFKDAFYNDLCYDSLNHISYVMADATGVETDGKELSSQKDFFYLFKLDSNLQLIKKVQLGGISDRYHDMIDRYTQVVLHQNLLYVGHVQKPGRRENSILSIVQFDLDLNKVREFEIATVETDGYDLNIKEFLKPINNQLYCILSVDHTTDIAGAIFKEAPGEDKKRLLFSKLENRKLKILGSYDATFHTARTWKAGSLNMFTVDSAENFYFSHSMISTFDDENFIHKFSPTEGVSVVKKLGLGEVQCLEIVDGKLRVVGIFKEGINWGDFKQLDEDYGFCFFEGTISLKDHSLSDFKYIMPTRHRSRFSATAVPTLYSHENLTLISYNLNSTTNALMEGKDQKPPYSTGFLTAFCGNSLMDQITVNGTGRVAIEKVVAAGDYFLVQGKIWQEWSEDPGIVLNLEGKELWSHQHSGFTYASHGFLIKIENKFPSIGHETSCLSDSFFAKNLKGTYNTAYWIIEEDTFYQKDVHLFHEAAKRKYTARFVGEKWQGFEFEKQIPIKVTSVPTAHFELTDSTVCQDEPLERINQSHIDSNFNAQKKLQFTWKAFQKAGKCFEMPMDTGGLKAGLYHLFLIAGNENCSDTSDTLQFTVYPIPKKGFTITRNETLCLQDSIWVGDSNATDSNDFLFIWNHTDSFRNFHYRSLAESGLQHLSKEVVNTFGCTTEDDTSIWVTPPDSFRNTVESYHVHSERYIQLKWSPTPLSGSSMELSVKPSSFLPTELNTTDTLFKHRGAYVKDSVYTYHITQVDSCDNTFENLIKAQSTVLKVDSPLRNPYRIYWNDMSRVNGEEVTYTLEAWRNGIDWNYLQTLKDTSTWLRFGEYIGYNDSIGLRITARSASLTSISNTLWISDPTEISRQNVFLDSILFEIDHLPAGSKYHFLIFEASGKVLYETRNISEPRIPFHPSASEVYFYHLTNELPTGEMKRRYGHLLFLHQ